jgi:hypothetical protein
MLLFLNYFKEIYLLSLKEIKAEEFPKSLVARKKINFNNKAQ